MSEGRSRPSIGERLRQARRLTHSEGVRGVAARGLIRMTDALRPQSAGSVPVRRVDLERADEIAAAGGMLPAAKPWCPGEPLEIAWVCGPAGEGSGGHTTMFRMIAALERAGHVCVVYIYDRHGWELEQHRRRIRGWWPWVSAEIQDLGDGIEDAHVILATSWETAYPVLASPALGKRCYFVQDFEPSFHPAGSTYLLAEATYGFGFHGVTAGPWLAQLLRSRYGMDADHFDFGCDVDRYARHPSRDGSRDRSAVCYFCRPSTPRRAHELAVMALELFSRRHPEIVIHAFGESAGRLPFAAVDHGLVAPEALAELYSNCIAGLVMSATNVSLVPLEMLAAGCIPVVNDAEHNRMVLANDHVRYAPATPFALAEALSQLVCRPASERAEAAEAAAQVELPSWELAGTQVERILREAVPVAELVA